MPKSVSVILNGRHSLHYSLIWMTKANSVRRHLLITARWLKLIALTWNCVNNFALTCTTLIYCAQVGEPIMRPLFLEFPHEQINYTPQVGHEFMLGPNLLIHQSLMVVKMATAILEKITSTCQTTAQCGLTCSTVRNTWVAEFTTSNLTHLGTYLSLFVAVQSLT